VTSRLKDSKVFLPKVHNRPSVAVDDRRREGHEIDVSLEDGRGRLWILAARRADDEKREDWKQVDRAVGPRDSRE
jgi:hypothetical protein